VADSGRGPLAALVHAAEACKYCAPHLPLGPRPVLRAGSNARILIVGQAPGTRVHESGIPWNDASGKRLREWMQLTPDEFYDTSKIAIVPMGFCFPGTGKSGDLPPRPECAPLWHARLLALMPHIELTLLVGSYAQAYYLGSARLTTMSETVKNFEAYAPAFLPLAHPSPRNQIWLKKNPWYAERVIPYLKRRVHQLL
jgi:uracil-DNA glycosylase